MGCQSAIGRRIVALYAFAPIFLTNWRYGDSGFQDTVTDALSIPWVIRYTAFQRRKTPVTIKPERTPETYAERNRLGGVSLTLMASQQYVCRPNT